MVDIEFVVNTGAAVFLIRKDVWTPLVKRHNALSTLGKSLWGFMQVQKCAGFVKGQSILVTCIVTDDIMVDAILGLV